MKALTRLTEGAGTEFERSLLDSARDDAVPREAKARVAAGLGIELAPAQVQADPPGHAPADEWRALAKASVKETGVGALVKYTFIGILGGVSAVSATSAPEPASASAVAGAAAIELSSVEPGPAQLAVQSLAIDGAATVSEPAETPPRAPPVAAPPPSARPVRLPPSGAARLEPKPPSGASAGSTGQLLAEVRQLDRVRAALDAAQSQTALRELDRYEAELPRGELALEALVLRVRALQRAGQFATAVRLARRALELPGSERYRPQLERIVGSESTSVDQNLRASTLDGAR